MSYDNPYNRDILKQLYQIKSSYINHVNDDNDDFGQLRGGSILGAYGSSKDVESYYPKYAQHNIGAAPPQMEAYSLSQKSNVIKKKEEIKHLEEMKENAEEEAIDHVKEVANITNEKEEENDDDMGLKEMFGNGRRKKKMKGKGFFDDLLGTVEQVAPLAMLAAGKPKGRPKGKSSMKGKGFFDDLLGTVEQVAPLAMLAAGKKRGRPSKKNMKGGSGFAEGTNKDLGVEKTLGAGKKNTKLKGGDVFTTPLQSTALAMAGLGKKDLKGGSILGDIGSILGLGKKKSQKIKGGNMSTDRTVGGNKSTDRKVGGQLVDKRQMKSSMVASGKKANPWTAFVKKTMAGGSFKNMKEAIKHIKDNNLYKK